MTQNNPQAQRLSPDPPDWLELIACQLANVAGITAGLGALPLLYDRLGYRFWMVEAVVGALCVGVGLFFLERRTPRLRPFIKRLLTFVRRLPSTIKRLLNFFRHMPAFFRRTWDWIRRHLPGRRKSALEPLSPEVPAERGSPPAAALPAAPPTASAAVAPARASVLLPSLTLLIGLFILLPAVLVACLHYDWAKGLGQVALVQIAVYFSAPALLIWVIGEILYIVPKIGMKPWDASILTAILKSGTQVLGAVLVWVFLALALVRKEQLWLLYGGLGLALVGLVLGFISDAIVRQRIRSQKTPQDLEIAG